MSYCKRTYEHVKGKNGGDRRSEEERQTDRHNERRDDLKLQQTAKDKENWS